MINTATLAQHKTGKCPNECPFDLLPVERIIDQAGVVWDYFDPDPESGRVSREMWCPRCGAVWRETYQLVSVEEVRRVQPVETRDVEVA